MSGIKRIAILAVLAIGTYILMSSIYTVSEIEQAIITQFGRPIGAPVTGAGLKFKVPFIQDVNLIDKRVLEWDGNPSDMPTKDKLYVSVDLFARWRIVDPLQYFLRLHDERSAQSRLDDILGVRFGRSSCTWSESRHGTWRSFVAGRTGGPSSFRIRPGNRDI